MKRGFIFMLSALVLLSTLAGCGGSVSPSETTSSSAPETTAATTDRTLSYITEPPAVDNTYVNPLLTSKTEGGWENGFGDPYVMRWNGRYYLYCSSDASLTVQGVKLFSSDDLINWRYDGFCCTDSTANGAYAPEVVYYNGHFYMYTSPFGNGHYVFKSDSPYGPFERVTENFGLSIDGSVFIDDDGEWYFYSASMGSIKRYDMSSPTSVSPLVSGSFGKTLKNWTEGPMMIKVNGRYFFTYTGNDVLSDGYRVAYDSGNTVDELTAGTNNPILLNTDHSAPVGLGHSSSVLGPDLDSYYIAYHSWQSTAPGRATNIAELVFNGREMYALGETHTPQQVPSLPDLYGRFTSEADSVGWSISGGSFGENGLTLQSGGLLLSEESFSGDITAELNLAIWGGADILFDYTDEKNFSRISLNEDKTQLTVSAYTDGVVTAEAVLDLPVSFGEYPDFSKLQCLTIVRQNGQYTFKLNALTMSGDVSAIPARSGRIGISAGSPATVGFVGVTASAGMTSVKDRYKPLTSGLEAITCVERDVTLVERDETYLVEMGETPLNFYVNADADGNYDLTVKYCSTEDAVLAIMQNGREIARIDLPSTSGELLPFVFRGIEIKSGFSVLTFDVVSGSILAKRFDLAVGTAVTEITYDFTNLQYAPYLVDGNWQLSQDGAYMKQDMVSIGKCFFGLESDGDYSVTAEIEINTDGVASLDILFRATDPADGYDFFCGYCLSLSSDRIQLFRSTYGNKQLASAKAELLPGNGYTVRIDAVGNVFKIYLDGNLLIEYTDLTPYVNGMIGFRSYGSGTRIVSTTVSPIQ